MSESIQRVPRHIFEARQRNAQRIGERIKDLLDSGHMVFDDEGDRVERVQFVGFGDVPGGLRFGNIIYFHPDPSCANGAFESIAEFNEPFKKWRAVKPADFQPIF